MLSYYARKNELALSMQSGAGVCSCGLAYKIQHVVTLMALSSIKEGELMLITRTQAVFEIRKVRICLIVAYASCVEFLS
jgi:hypothetical protein